MVKNRFSFMTLDDALARADADDNRTNKERMRRIINEYFRNLEDD